MVFHHSARVGLRAIIVAGVTLLACGDDQTPERQNAGALSKCVPNQTLVCTCGIERGVQKCSSDGQLSACDCSTTEQTARESPAKASSGEQSEKDASTDAPAPDKPATPPLGPNCAKLQACCVTLDENQIHSDFCYDAVKTRLEDVCHLKLEAYASDPEGLPCP